MAQKVYIDETTPVMVNKVELPGRSTRPVDFGVFQSTYVPLLNNAAEKLKKQKFSSRKEAFLVPNDQVVFSFLVGSQGEEL